MRVVLSALLRTQGAYDGLYAGIKIAKNTIRVGMDKKAPSAREIRRS